CAMLLARDALEAVGGLDERFFAYHEDVDWCASARAAGFRILFAPEARVVHRGEGSLAGRGPANPARYLSARNTVLFARKHGRPRQWVVLATAIAASLPLAALRTWHGGQRGVAGLLWRGDRDGLLGRPLPLRELGVRSVSSAEGTAASARRRAFWPSHPRTGVLPAWATIAGSNRCRGRRRGEETWTDTTSASTASGSPRPLARPSCSPQRARRRRSRSRTARSGWPRAVASTTLPPPMPT